MYNLANSVLKIQRAIRTAAGLTPAGTVIRLFHYTKITVAPGAKTSYLKGAELLPIDILSGTAEPKAEIECSNGPEVWDARRSIGGIYTPIIVTVSFARQGFLPRLLTIEGAWGDGGGLELDETNGSKPDKIVVPATDILDDLRSIYNKAA